MENDFIGRRISYGLAIESVRGTAEDSAEFWLPHLDAGFQDKQTKALNESALGVIDKNNDSIVTEEWAEGNINGKVMVNSFVGLLLLALGDINTTAGTGAGTHKHVLSRLNSNLGKSATLFRKDPVASVRYALSVLSSLEISIVTGEYVTFTAEFVGRKSEDHDNTVSFAVDEAEFTSKYAAVKIGAYGANLSAAPAQAFKSATISISREVEAYYELGSVTPKQIHNKTFDVTVAVEKRHSDNTFKDYAHDNTKLAFAIDLVNTDDKIGTANDTNPSITFAWPKVVVSEWELGQGLDDIVSESFTLQGLFDTVSGKQMDVTVVNETAAY